MTDQPPDDRSAEPPDSDLPTPDSPTEPSGVGFAAIQPPGPVGYQGPPPGPAGYQGPPPGYFYAPPPPAPRSGGPSVVLVGLIALVLVAVVGVSSMFALGIGPFARPTPTPIARPTDPPSTPPPTSPPTALPTVTPTSGATAAPPTPTPIPIASGDVAALLLSHVPAALAGTCVAAPGGSPILAIATCIADDGAIEVTYFQYNSQEAMSQAYEGFRLTSEIEPDTGNCSDPTTWPTEDEYTIGDQPAGRYLCTEALGQTTIYWTDDRLNILSQATHTTADYARLFEFWTSESGPYL